MRNTASELRLYFVIQTTAHRLKKLADLRLQAASGVTTAQAAVLTLIHSGQPLSQREVSRQLRQQESATATMVARLISLGMIDRTRSLEDQRVWELSLTPSGRTALGAARPAFDEINDMFGSLFSDDELLVLAESFERLNAALSDVAE